MSLIVIHLRWNDVAAEQYEQFCHALVSLTASCDGCYSRQPRRQGRAVLDTQVWRGVGEAERFLDRVAAAVRPCGVEEAPLAAVFSVPDVFAAGYTRNPGHPAISRPRSAQPSTPGPSERAAGALS
jgi:hypothetical protein